MEKANQLTPTLKNTDIGTIGPYKNYHKNAPTMENILEKKDKKSQQES